MSSLDDWNYELPDSRIARHPTARRDQSRLMVLDRATGLASAGRFLDILDHLRPGDLLVANNTRVMAARLHVRRSTGGKVELLILDFDNERARALARPARKLKPGERLSLPGGEQIEVGHRGDGAGEIHIRASRGIDELMRECGEMPLPPYLKRSAEPADSLRYQTVYAGPLGAAAAPTAGLHFTREVLERLEDRGIFFDTVTLHVGIGTFRPVTEEDMARARLHSEWYDVPVRVAEKIAATRANGGRVIAVGTTSARTLESATKKTARVPSPGSAETDLFIQPPYSFRCVDGLLTNFHLPKSSLLMLVAALTDRETLFQAYDQAIDEGFRFYSYGDAMLIL